MGLSFECLLSCSDVTLDQKGEEAATEQQVKDRNFHYFP